MRLSITSLAAFLVAVQAAPEPQIPSVNHPPPGVTFNGPLGGSLNLNPFGYTAVTPTGGGVHLGLDGFSATVGKLQFNTSILKDPMSRIKK
jgi:hypothetical protein